LDISSLTRLVIPVEVVEQPTLLIRILPREPQVLRKAPQPARVGLRCRRPEGLAQPAPAHLVVAVHHDARRVQVIGVDEVHQRHAARARRVRREHRHRRVLQPHVLAQRVARWAVLPEQLPLQVVRKHHRARRPRAAHLAHPPSVRVVGVRRRHPALRQRRQLPAQVVRRAVPRAVRRVVERRVARAVVAEAPRRVRDARDAVARAFETRQLLHLEEINNYDVFAAQTYMKRTIYLPSRLRAIPK